MLLFGNVDVCHSEGTHGQGTRNQGQFWGPAARVVIVNVTARSAVMIAYEKLHFKEKNWIPFTVGGRLYVSYQLNPWHQVMAIDTRNSTRIRAQMVAETLNEASLGLHELRKGKLVPTGSDITGLHGGTAYVEFPKH